MPQASDRSLATPMIRPRLPAINGATPAPTALREISFILWLNTSFPEERRRTYIKRPVPSKPEGRELRGSADDLPVAVGLAAGGAPDGRILVADRLGEFPAIGAVFLLEGADGRDVDHRAARRVGPARGLA